MVKKFLKFGLVGVLNTLIDYGVFQILVHLFDLTKSHPVTMLGYSFVLTAGSGIFLASCLSGTVAVINSYYFNKKFTFQHNSTDHIRLFTKFAIVSAISVLLNSTFTTVLSKFFQPFYTIGSIKIESVSFTKLIAIIIILGFNFFVYQKFVFNK